MPKPIDFAKQRRELGRSLTRAALELATLLPTLTQQQGIDPQAILDEASIRKATAQLLLAERLQESVVPLFIDRAGQPDRIGTCVLVGLDSDLFAFTAAHVIRDADSSTLLAPSQDGELLPLSSYTTYLSPPERDNDLDVGVLALSSRRLGVFQRRTFLSGTEIDQSGRPDNQSFQSFYFVLGYSASRTQAKVHKIERRIHQQSFHCSTNPVDKDEYLQERMSHIDHILLDFDHNEIMTERKRANPPKLQGVSGGGIFEISRGTMSGPLVAIATQNRRRSRLIIGTRLQHFLASVRELKTTPRSS